MFSIAVLSHSPGVVYYHLLLRRETRIPGVAPFSFRIGIWDLFVHRGQKSYTPTAFVNLITPGLRHILPLLSNISPPLHRGSQMAVSISNRSSSAIQEDLSQSYLGIYLHIPLPFLLCLSNDSNQVGFKVLYHSKSSINRHRFSF